MFKVLIYAVVIATVIETGYFLTAIVGVTLFVFIKHRKKIIENMKLGGQFVEWKLKEIQNKKNKKRME